MTNKIKNIDTKKENRNEVFILILILLLVIIISYTHVEESISVFKYLFFDDLDKLIYNYHLFLNSPKQFFRNTLMLHPGGSIAGQKTIFYLLPLFSFLKLMGGLNFKNIYLFTITTSIIYLLLFYYWVKKYWGSRVALWASLSLGYSAIFQEIARSGSYISFSIPIAVILIILAYRCSENTGRFSYLLLGTITGLAMYGYAMLRGLISLPLYIIFTRENRKVKSFLSFIIGSAISILPGLIFGIINNNNEKFNRDYLINILYNYHAKEKININLDLVSYVLREFGKNITYFIHRILGGKQYIIPVLINNYHSHFINKLLIIPFFIGLYHVIKLRKEKKYKLMLIISILIYFFPMLSCSEEYYGPRRSIFYIIPTYFYVGIGVSQFFNYLKKIKHKRLKVAMLLLNISLIIFVIISEISYSKRYILFSYRDLGLLNFAREINKAGIKEDVYYLATGDRQEKRAPEMKRYSVYYHTEEKIILELALQNNKQKVVSISNMDNISGIRKVYLVKSPLMPEKDFKILCDEYNLNPKLIILSAVVNFPYIEYLKDNAFKLYSILDSDENDSKL